MGKKETQAEDLAIQNTLTMSISERLQLLAALIVDKIDEDQRNGDSLYDSINEVRNA